MGRGTAVVTGASSGIGAATARRLVVEGYDVVGVAPLAQAAAHKVHRVAAPGSS